MKIREIIIDALMKTSLFEIAFSKADAIKKVSDLQIVHKLAEDILSRICSDISENKFRDIRIYLNIS